MKQQTASTVLLVPTLRLWPMSLQLLALHVRWEGIRVACVVLVLVTALHVRTDRHRALLGQQRASTASLESSQRRVQACSVRAKTAWSDGISHQQPWDPVLIARVATSLLQ